MELDSDGDQEVEVIEQDPYEVMLGTLPPPPQQQPLQQQQQQQGARRPTISAVSNIVSTRRREAASETEPSSKRTKTSQPQHNSSIPAEMTVAEGLARLKNLTPETAADLSWTELERLRSLQQVIGKQEKEAKKEGEMEDGEAVKITGELKIEYGNGKVKTVKIDETSDKGHSMIARHFMRVPNSPASDWFTKVDGLNLAHPVRGSGQHLAGILGPQRINDSVLKLLHSRTSNIHHKMLLTKNACLDQQQKLIMLEEDNTSARIGSKWQEASSCFEVVEAIFNYDAAIYYIRAYSYESRAIIRGLHRLRWFQSTAESPKSQMKLLSGGFDRLLQRNRSRASEGQVWGQNTIKKAKHNMFNISAPA